MHLKKHAITKQKIKKKLKNQRAHRPQDFSFFREYFIFFHTFLKVNNTMHRQMYLSFIKVTFLESKQDKSKLRKNYQKKKRTIAVEK